MKLLKFGVPAIVVLFLVAVWLAPIGPMPGIFIGGTSATVPDSWASVSGDHEVKLSVAGPLPRVVIVWVIDVDNTLYVVGSKSSGWVSMLGDGGDVQLRVKDNTYEMNASLVGEGWQPIMEAYKNKYAPDYPDIVAGFPSVDEAQGLISVFKLEART